MFAASFGISGLCFCLVNIGKMIKDLEVNAPHLGASDPTPASQRPENDKRCKKSIGNACAMIIIKGPAGRSPADSKTSQVSRMLSLNLILLKSDFG